MKPIVSLVVAMLVIAAFTAVPTSFAADQVEASKPSPQPAKPAGMDQVHWEKLVLVCSGSRGMSIRESLHPMMEKNFQKECKAAGHE